VSQDCALAKLNLKHIKNRPEPIELQLNKKRHSPDLDEVMEEQMLQESATPTRHLNQLSQAEYQTIN